MSKNPKNHGKERLHQDEIKFSTHLPSQTVKVINDLSVLNQEIGKVENIISKKSKIYEKHSKSISMTPSQHKFEHLDLYVKYLIDFSNHNSKIHQNFVKSCNMQVESLERLRKFLDSSRKNIKQRMMNNDKIYYKKSRILENIQKKQQKVAKEAHDKYIKHDLLMRKVSETDPTSQEIDYRIIDELELKFIHAAKKEETHSQQYRDIFEYHKDYMREYDRENASILDTVEEFYIMGTKNMKAHMLRFCEDMEEIIVTLRKANGLFRKDINQITPEKNIVEKYILKNSEIGTGHNNQGGQVEQISSFGETGKKIHSYEPFMPIYKLGEQQRLEELEKIHKQQSSTIQEVQIDPAQQHSSIRDFVGGLLGKGRKPSVSIVPKKTLVNNLKANEPPIQRRRRGTQKVYNTLVKSPQIAKQSSSLYSPFGNTKKSESQIFYESLYEELISTKKKSKKSVASSSIIIEEENNLKKEKIEELDEDEDISLKTNISEEKKKKALGWLEMVEGRRGFVCALNRKRGHPYIENFSNFEFLGSLLRKCLSLGHSKQDRDVGSNLLNMSQTFYTLDSDENQLFFFKYLSDMKKVMDQIQNLYIIQDTTKL